MSEKINEGTWWSYPAEGHSGQTVIVTGRDNVDNFRNSGKYVYRVTVSWDYQAKPDGMPNDEDAAAMEEITDALLNAMHRDKVAVMTGIYTGEGRRDWVIYTRNLKVFSSLFNRALEHLPVFPLLIEAEEDAQWEEYTEMRNSTYIP